MRKQRRSDLEIFRDVCLTITFNQEAMKPTRIMYGSTLSWPALRKILDKMLRQGFIKELHVEGDGRTSVLYDLTTKGSIFIRLLEVFF